MPQDITPSFITILDGARLPSKSSELPGVLLLICYFDPNHEARKRPFWWFGMLSCLLASWRLAGFGVLIFVAKTTTYLEPK